MKVTVANRDIFLDRVIKIEKKILSERENFKREYFESWVNRAWTKKSQENRRNLGIEHCPKSLEYSLVCNFAQTSLRIAQRFIAICNSDGLRDIVLESDEIDLLIRGWD